jgi:hypothetical protein
LPVYVDSYQASYRGMKMSHMIADTAAELHAMADAIGVQRRWFQATASFPHYDVCETKRQLALAKGAVEVSREDFVAKMQQIRAQGAATGFVFKPRRSENGNGQ